MEAIALLLAAWLASSAPGDGAPGGWPRRPTDINTKKLSIVAESGELHYLSCTTLERGLGIPDGELKGIVLTALPGPSEGELTLYGVEAPLYERLGREEIDRLIYEPADAFISGRIAFIPEWGGLREASLNITVAARPPSRDEALRAVYVN